MVITEHKNMGIAEFVKAKALNGRTVGLIAFGLVVIYFVLHAFTPHTDNINKAFFTVDDGATWFTDSADRLAPFDHNGKPAYRLTMFSTDGGKTKFPAYLERYTPDGRARREQANQDLKAGRIKIVPIANPRDLEVKLPGAGNPWVSRANGTESTKILNAKVPPTTDTEFEVVFPS
jgi:hypothetical protein